MNFTLRHLERIWINPMVQFERLVQEDRVDVLPLGGGWAKGVSGLVETPAPGWHKG